MKIFFLFWRFVATDDSYKTHGHEVHLKSMFCQVKDFEKRTKSSRESRRRDAIFQLLSKVPSFIVVSEIKCNVGNCEKYWRTRKVGNTNLYRLMGTTYEGICECSDHRSTYLLFRRAHAVPSLRGRRDEQEERKRKSPDLPDGDYLRFSTNVIKLKRRVWSRTSRGWCRFLLRLPFWLGFTVWALVRTFQLTQAHPYRHTNFDMNTSRG